MDLTVSKMHAIQLHIFISIFLFIKNFLNSFNNLLGKKISPKHLKEHNKKWLIQETSNYQEGGESLNSKLHREFFTNYDLMELYSARVSGVVNYYQKMCQENAKITISDQIKTDVKILDLRIFTEFQEKLKNSNIDFSNETATGIFNALKKEFGVE